jgi:hypothetical protein
LLVVEHTFVCSICGEAMTFVTEAPSGHEGHRHIRCATCSPAWFLGCLRFSPRPPDGRDAACMPFSFKHASIPVEATREFDLGISTVADGANLVLVVKHAGEGNKGYWNALIKRVNAMSARGAGRGKLTAEQLDKARAETAEIFATHVVTGWKNAVEDGKPAPCTPEAVGRLLAALIAPPPDGRPDLFDELRKYCEDASNFTGPALDPVDLGKG